MSHTTSFAPLFGEALGDDPAEPLRRTGDNRDPRRHRVGWANGKVRNVWLGCCLLIFSPPRCAPPVLVILPCQTILGQGSRTLQNGIYRRGSRSARGTPAEGMSR